jgi:2-haloacid dehalogenase
MPQPSQRTAVFDIIGTSFSLDRPRQALTRLGAPEQAIELWFAQTLRDAFAFSHASGYAPLKEILAAELPRSLSQLGLKPSEAELNGVLATFTRLDPRPDLAEAVEALHVAGWHLLALTMGTAESTRALLEQAGVGDRFMACLSVDSIQVTKPSAAAYRLALEESNGETWMVAAHAWDIAGAARAGLRTAFITSVEGSYLNVYPEPDIVAGSLLEAARAMVAR